MHPVRWMQVHLAHSAAMHLTAACTAGLSPGCFSLSQPPACTVLPAFRATACCVLPVPQDEAGLSHLCWHERGTAGSTAAEPAVDVVIIPGESTFSQVQFLMLC